MLSTITALLSILVWVNELQDQLKREHNAGRIFRYMREGQIAFRPTYKFDRGPHCTDLAYDSSDKRRVPAWCDRIFFRGSAYVNNYPAASFCAVSDCPCSCNICTCWECQ